MAEPAVSVVLPVRDGERYLGEAVASILGQTLRNLELIVVDDGSTDASAEIAGGVGDERVRVLRRPAEGLVAALNAGLAEARGPLVARMDADDVSLPERLERQAAFLAAHPRVVLLATAVEVVDADGRRLRTESLPGDDAALRRRLLLRNVFPHGSVMLRREAVEAAGGYRNDYGSNEDYDLWRRLARAGELAALPGVLYRYREHATAVTRTDPGRTELRERLRDELWNEPSLLAAAPGERDRAEARALLREAARRGRYGLALRLVRASL